MESLQLFSICNHSLWIQATQCARMAIYTPAPELFGLLTQNLVGVLLSWRPHQGLHQTGHSVIKRTFLRLWSNSATFRVFPKWVTWCRGLLPERSLYANASPSPWQHQSNKVTRADFTALSNNRVKPEPLRFQGPLFYPFSRLFLHAGLQ